MSSLPQLDAIATLLDQGAADSAVRLLRSCWEPDLPPDDLVRMYCMWVRGLCETGEIDNALTLAKRAAGEFPREPDVLIALGNVHDLLGQLEQAREAFESAIDLDPHGPLQHYNLGAVLERQGRERDAEACYRRANDCDPNGGSMYEASAALGALLRRQGRLEEAEHIYDLYLSDDSINVDILVEHGICMSDLDRLDEAIERFDFALSLDPEHAGAQYNKAITLYRLGRYEQALQSLERARQLDKDNALTLAVLGGWRLSAPDCDLDEALGLLYGALDLLETRHANDWSQMGYCSLVAEEIFEALWQNGRRKEAREVARVSGQREWITPRMLDCLNEADHGRSPQVSMFTVVARAEARERPEHWPENTDGYTTGLTVLARDEAEAREFCLQYLRTIEPSPEIRFTLDIMPPQAPSDPSPNSDIVAEIRGAMQPRPRGVARVHGQRSYSFRSQ